MKFRVSIRVRSQAGGFGFGGFEAFFPLERWRLKGVKACCSLLNPSPKP